MYHSPLCHFDGFIGIRVTVVTEGSFSCAMHMNGTRLLSGADVARNAQVLEASVPADVSSHVIYQVFKHIPYPILDMVKENGSSERRCEHCSEEAFYSSGR